MRIYQILNSGGYPASFEITNPQALYSTKKECKEAIGYLKECSQEKTKFTIKRIF